MAKTATKKKSSFSELISRIKLINIHRIYKSGDFDIPFFSTVMALLVLGIIMMFSASYAWAANEGLAGDYYAIKQAKYAIIGFIIMLIMSRIDYHHYKTNAMAIIAYVVPVILLVLVLIIGTNDNGAQRWIRITDSFQFQPSELMKIGIIFVVSYYMDVNYKKLKSFKTGVLPFIVMLVIVDGLLMAQPHLSGTIIISFLCITLMIVGGSRFYQILIIGIMGVAALIGVVYIKTVREGYGYFMNRIHVWIDPFSDIQNTTWQTCQSLIAIGSGGFFGLGLGESKQKYLYLPESKNDFVFSIVCEELGFVGALTIILLFVLLVFRGIQIASRAKDRFGMLLATGFTLHIGIQALLNIAVVSNLIPNTGISLPFFSYGGTALILELFEMGIVLNISRTRYNIPDKNKKKKKTVETTENVTPPPRLEA